MPIVISRNTDAPPVMEPALSPQQREQLWAHIVRNWAAQNADSLAALVRQEPAGHNASEPCGV